MLLVAELDASARVQASRIITVGTLAKAATPQRPKHRSRTRGESWQRLRLKGLPSLLCQAASSVQHLALAGLASLTHGSAMISLWRHGYLSRLHSSLESPGSSEAYSPAGSRKAETAHDRRSSSQEKCPMVAASLNLQRPGLEGVSRDHCSGTRTIPGSVVTWLSDSRHMVMDESLAVLWLTSAIWWTRHKLSSWKISAAPCRGIARRGRPARAVMPQIPWPRLPGLVGEL